MEPLLHDGMCRCCATEGTFKDFLTTYHWMGEEEIYADMLKDCFSISLITSEEINNGGICEICITQLRNAVSFKRQVLQTEQQFKKRLDDSMFKTNQEIKLELSHDGDTDNNLSEDYVANDFELPIKVEKEEKPKKRSARASTSKAKKSKTDEGEPSAKRNPPETKNFEEIESDIISTKRKIKPGNQVNRKARITIKTKKIKLKPIKELSKHHHNIKEILQCSNTTPIHGKSDIGYLCCYCPEQFLNPADLKSHTIQHHKNASKPKFFQKRDLQKFYVKVDITALKCNICNNDIDNLDSLIDHLKTKHDRRIYTDVKNHMVPFKFDSEELKCFVCSNVYTKFKMLLEHMHKHCRNFICDLCGSGFFNRRSYLNHLKCHTIGEFKCDRCDKVFDNAQKKNQHIRTVHVHGYLLNRCGYCNEKFAGYRTKAEHLRTVHGVGSETAKCQACEKSFCNKDSLRKHIKRHHLMENQYACTLCEMKFFARKNLVEHMVTHTKTRSFQCGVCFKRYGRQHTLREHMRIHNNDRRFKCEHCGMAFVQKCSWRRHMQSKHDEQV